VRRLRRRGCVRYLYAGGQSHAAVAVSIASRP
jgi:hypothetical protein